MKIYRLFNKALGRRATGNWEPCIYYGKILYM